MVATLTDRSMVQVELRTIQDGPEDVGEGLCPIIGGLSPVDEAEQMLKLLGPGAAGQGREVEGFDPARRVQEWSLDDCAKHLAALRVRGAVDVGPVHHG